MAKVNGIGGVFFKARHHKTTLSAWYAKHLCSNMMLRVRPLHIRFADISIFLHPLQDLLNIDLLISSNYSDDGSVGNTSIVSGEISG